MEKKQTHREPTLYIVGNDERKDEIKHILEDEWGGNNIGEYEYTDFDSAYCINTLGIISQVHLKDDWFNRSIANGWMKEYKLPEKLQFKTFDKVVVRVPSKWIPGIFGYREGDEYWIQGYGWVDISKTIILPYNDETAKLIGTSDEWKGGEE